MVLTQTNNATRFGELPESVTIRIREPGSAFTHGAALLGTLMGAGPLLLKAKLSGSSVTVLSMWIFLISACILYGASTVYHSVVLDKKRTDFLRRIDHMSISILIAGTYTPVCLTALKGRMGTVMLCAIWVFAIIGIVFKALWFTCPKWLSSLLYLGMGWMCIAGLPSIHRSLPPGAFLWLLIGGILYTAGAVIYALRVPAFDEKHPVFGSHEIFHCFIMAGSFCHYMLMLQYLCLIG